jgi:hypothetical protein
MNVEYELNLDDVKAHLLYSFNHNPKMKRTRNLMSRITIPLAIVVIILALIIVLTGGKRDISAAVIVGACGVYLLLFSIFYRKFTLWIISRSLMKVYGQRPNRIAGKHQLSVTPDAVIDINEIGQSTTHWNGIEWFASNDQYLFLSFRYSIFYIVPRRAFPSEGAFNQFVEAAKSYYQAANPPP